MAGPIRMAFVPADPLFFNLAESVRPVLGVLERSLAHNELAHEAGVQDLRPVLPVTLTQLRDALDGRNGRQAIFPAAGERVGKAAHGAKTVELVHHHPDPPGIVRTERKNFPNRERQPGSDKRPNRGELGVLVDQKEAPRPFPDPFPDAEIPVRVEDGPGTEGLGTDLGHAPEKTVVPGRKESDGFRPRQIRFQGFGIDVVVASGAALLLLVTPGRVSVLSHVDWSTLLLFVGLFIVMAAEVSAGVVASMTGQLPLASRPTSGGISATGVGVIMLASVIGSQIFSNVPWVALSLPAMVGLGYSSATPIPWMALAAGSTLAGNITLLGAASNLIIVQQANKAGVQVRLLEFAKYGAPLAAISLLVTFACLALHL